VSPASILLADDHALVRKGLKLVLDGEPDFRVVAEASNGAEAVEKGADAGVDLAILDVGMPRMTGLQAAAALNRSRPELPVLLLSMHENEQYLCEAAGAGASGYVLKAAVDRELVDACRSALRGGREFVCPAATSARVRERVARAAAGEPVAIDPLSPREREVVKLIAEGHSGREIAETLCISEKTVDRHRANVFAKLALRNRLDVARYAIRTGLVDA
jgi:DNA-binding NarL/FixJ family response regulator